MPGQLSGRRPDHRVRWRAGVGQRPLAVRRLRRSWAMQRTVPAELASTSPVRQLCPTGVGGTAPCCRGQALPDPPAHRAGHHAIAGRRCAESTHGAPDHTRAIARKDASLSGAGVDCRASRPGARRRLAPTRWAKPFASGTWAPRWGGIPLHRGLAVPDPPARQGRQIDAKGCGGVSTIAAGAVGSECPRLKPRAQSASPLKGAVRRTGALVDRLGGGAVGVSRLQPAWGLSPAVHGRAIVERAARLIGAACRTRRVGHVESPRRPARAGEAPVAPTRWANPFASGIWAPRWGDLPAPVGVRRCLTRRPGRPAVPG